MRMMNPFQVKDAIMTDSRRKGNDILRAKPGNYWEEFRHWEHAMRFILMSC
jgi:hypothetical protein